MSASLSQSSAPGTVWPAPLVERIEEIRVAAMHLAYAARPLPSAIGVVDYWRTLDALKQQPWIVRAMRDVAEALGMVRR